MDKIKHILKNPLTYKIFIDILFLLIITTAIFLAFEVIIPGIITIYISPFILFSSLFILVWLVAKLAHHINVAAQITRHNKIITVLTSFFFALLIGIVGFRYGFFLDSIIVIFSLLTFILLHSLARDMMHS